MRLLKAGTRARCAVCDTEVMVVRTVPAEVLLTCGDVEMIAMDGARTPGSHAGVAAAQLALVGKRYVNATDAVELLCTKGGKGSWRSTASRWWSSRPKRCLPRTSA